MNFLSKSFLQRTPDNLLAQVDAWALSHGEVNRTVAINILIVQGLESDERESLRAKVEDLQKEVTKLNSVHMPLIKALQKAAGVYENTEKGNFAPAFKKERRAEL